MIRSTSPGARLNLVVLRAISMTKGASEALEAIHNLKHTSDHNVFDNIPIALLEAQINFLAGRYAEALSIFEQKLDPALSNLDPRLAVLIADNKGLILSQTFDPSSTSQFYHLVDQRRVLGVELRDYAALNDAREHALEGEDYRALPGYWCQLLAAYESQNWRALAMAEKDFALECMNLGWFCEAAYHSMLSLSNDTSENIAKKLLETRSSEIVGNVLLKILLASQLQMHAAQLSRMLEILADAIPHEALPAVTEWLKKWAAFIPASMHDASLFEHVWGTIALLAQRLNREEVDYFIQYALTHPMLSGGVLRKHLIIAMNALCSKADTSQLDLLSETAISLVSDNKGDMDFRDAVNLVYHLSNIGNEDLKVKIKTKLFPPGIEVSDTLLLQLAPLLGCEVKDPAYFSAFANSTADAIRQQVQYLAASEAPAHIGGFGTICLEGPEKKIIVHIAGGRHLIDALIPYRHLIVADCLLDLLAAILEMIANNNNIIENRVMLTQQLSKFSDCLERDFIHNMVAVLEPLAHGEIIESPMCQTYAQANSPLNPFRMQNGDPDDLRGVALTTLAEMDQLFPGMVSNFHSQLLTEALTSSRPKVRQYGLIAAQKNGLLTPSELTMIALAGLDSDHRVGMLALQAIQSTFENMKLEPTAWHIVLRCLELAVHSPDVDMRRSAAGLINKISNAEAPSELRGRLAVVKGLIQDDICWSVRQKLARE